MVNMSTGVEFYFRTVSFLPSLPPVVVSLSGAVIDKAYLKWLDISKLLATFPEHVKVLGDNVTFQGPVAIVSSFSPMRRLFLQSMGAIFPCLLFHMFMRKVILKKERVISSYFPDVKQAAKAMLIFNVVGTVLSLGAGFYLAGRCLPTQAGVHFYGQLSFYA
jgi:hypothetical protein